MLLNVTGQPIGELGIGPQGVGSIPVIHAGVAPVDAIACGIVRVGPGARARVHIHAGTETIIHVVTGRAATLAGDRLEQVVVHAAGSVLYIGPGVPHLALNLSADDEVVGFEVCTDPTYNRNTVLRPDLEELAELRVRETLDAYRAGDFKDLLAVPTSGSVRFQAG